MNDQQYFFIDNFLDTDLVSAIATEKTKLATIETLPDNCGHFINPDGIVVDDSTHPNIYNRYHDNSMLKSLLPKSVGNLIDKIRPNKSTPYNITNSKFSAIKFIHFFKNTQEVM